VRHLLYIPVIHDEADLGGAGPALAHRSAALAGEGRWVLHRETVRRFWESVQNYLRRFDPYTMRVYQDGLAVDGVVGRRIAEKGAGRGSRNYQLVLELLNQGAQLQATEDPALLLEEHANLVTGGSQAAPPEQREYLLEERDAYIAQVINSTLQEGELGVLFIGAGHDVGARLAHDVGVESFKDPEKIRQYIQELLLGSDARKLKALARYVAAPATTGRRLPRDG